MSLDLVAGIEKEGRNSNSDAFLLHTLSLSLAHGFCCFCLVSILVAVNWYIIHVSVCYNEVLISYIYFLFVFNNF